jgi:hypothetical protein
MKKQLQAVAASYGRTAVSAALGMYMAGHTDAKSIGLAAAGAVAGPLLRALNPKDTAFGVGGGSAKSAVME